MIATVAARRPCWSEVVLPKEHGSWSLALEPVALGLLAAPSVAGGWLAGAVVAGFLARRPLKIVVREGRGARRSVAGAALATLLALASAALIAAVATGGGRWLAGLAPSVVLGVVFVGFDLRNAWRAEMAEVIGAAAFAGLSGALAAAAGWPGRAALALALAMLGRAVPTVIFVRAAVRGGKTGRWRLAPALRAAALALAGGVALRACGLASTGLIVALGLLMARSGLLLRAPSIPLQPRTIGFVELALGVAYVVSVAASWPAPMP